MLLLLLGWEIWIDFMGLVFYFDFDDEDDDEMVIIWVLVEVFDL